LVRELLLRARHHDEAFAEDELRVFDGPGGA
jgi:hypothetical protein